MTQLIFCQKFSHNPATSTGMAGAVVGLHEVQYIIRVNPLEGATPPGRGRLPSRKHYGTIAPPLSCSYDVELDIAQHYAA